MYVQLGIFSNRCKMIPCNPMQIPGVLSLCLFLCSSVVHLPNIPESSTLLNANFCLNCDSEIPLYTYLIVPLYPRIQKIILAREPGQLQHSPDFFPFFQGSEAYCDSCPMLEKCCFMYFIQLFLKKKILLFSVSLFFSFFLPRGHVYFQVLHGQNKNIILIVNGLSLTLYC